MNTKLALEFYEDIVFYRDFLVEEFMSQLVLFLDPTSRNPGESLIGLQSDLSQIEAHQRVIEDMANLSEFRGKKKVLTLNKEYMNLRECVENLRDTNIERGAE